MDQALPLQGNNLEVEKNQTFSLYLEIMTCFGNEGSALHMGCFSGLGCDSILYYLTSFVVKGKISHDTMDPLLDIGTMQLVYNQLQKAHSLNISLHSEALWGTEVSKSEMSSIPKQALIEASTRES